MFIGNGHTRILVDAGISGRDICTRLEAIGEKPESLDAVLITHEHPDHVHPDHLRGSGVPIWTIAAVQRLLREQAPEVADRVTVVRPGDRLEVAGTAVEVAEERGVRVPMREG